MKALILLVTLAGSFSLTERAEAACPHGQIRRISMHRCVSIHSALARGYVHANYTALRRTHVRHAGRCDPRTMCGDPIEDRVRDEPQTNTPHQSSDPTPRGDNWTPDGFINSHGNYHIDWRL